MPTPNSEPAPGSAVEYAYLFEKDKGPTKQLDALLRAIARHIMLQLGDKTDPHLTPSKLAAFYKAVGGDYDSLFVDMPHSSISFAWQVTGCQHTLQPTHDDFAPPSIPALTLRGFSRWESLEILLGPEEHVPFMQQAVKDWALKHPETGEDFPPDLPASVFPAYPEPRFTRVRMNPLRPSPPRPRAAETDYFGRPVSYTHLPGRQRRPDRSPRRDGLGQERMRRKSFSDYGTPLREAEPLYHAHSSPYLDAGLKRPSQARRHSHPSHDDSSDSSDEPLPEGINRKPERRRREVSPPPPSVRRFIPPTAPVPPPATSNAPPLFRRHRSDMRSDEPKRRNVASPLGSLRNKLSETVSSMLPNGLTLDRPRAGSRQSSSSDAVRARKSREPYQPSRLNHSFSDVDSNNSSDPSHTEGDGRRRRRMQDERERGRERERERYHRQRARELERDWNDGRELGGRGGKGRTCGGRMRSGEPAAMLISTGNGAH